MSLNCWHIPTNEEEIVDVFIEEVGELLGNIDDGMKTWMNNPGDTKTLSEIRRSFHTLKGSGRMVGLDRLSELARELEHLLDRALESADPAGADLVRLTELAYLRLVDWIARFREDAAAPLDSAGLATWAARVAAARRAR